MKRNIMLLFLSDVKVFGPDNAIRLTRYEDVGETAATNESAMRKLAKDLEGESLDRFFVVATDKVLYEQIPGQGMNHLDFFYQRLQDVFPHIEEITEVIPYKTEASMQEGLCIMYWHWRNIYAAICEACQRATGLFCMQILRGACVMPI